jgi:hypothetical protein
LIDSFSTEPNSQERTPVRYGMALLKTNRTETIQWRMECFFYRRPRPRPMPMPIIAPGGGGGGGSIPGAPTPCIGAAPSPIGAPPMGGGPPPADIPRPRPAMLAAAALLLLLLPDGGGGPSTAKLTTFSPRISTNPRLRRSVRSSKRAAPDFRKIRNSSASLSTKFKCLSKAKKVPMMDRPSWRVTRRRCSTYRSSLLPFPLGWNRMESAMCKRRQ